MRTSIDIKVTLISMDWYEHRSEGLETEAINQYQSTRAFRQSLINGVTADLLTCALSCFPLVDLQMVMNLYHCMLC